MKSNLLQIVVLLSLFSSFCTELLAEHEVFWRETATAKIKIMVDNDTVIGRWVFSKKSATGRGTARTQLRPERAFTNSQGMTMAWIRRGSFKLGSLPYKEARENLGFRCIVVPRQRF